jgi:hypothetical protein
MLLLLGYGPWAVVESQRRLLQRGLERRFDSPEFTTLAGDHDVD